MGAEGPCSVSLVVAVHVKRDFTIIMENQIEVSF